MSDDLAKEMFDALNAFDKFSEKDLKSSEDINKLLNRCAELCDDLELGNCSELLTCLLEK
jgi:hypothetical protein